MNAPIYPAVQRLLSLPNVTALSGGAVAAFIAEGTSALFFIGSAKRYPEVDDVAIVLPELMREYPGRFRVGVVDADTEPAVAQRFGIGIRPTLVFVRDGVEIGTIPRMRDWSVYLAEISALLATPRSVDQAHKTDPDILGASGHAEH